MKLALGLYAIYLLMVAINGNAGALTTQLKTDMPHFLPWLIIAAVLGALYDEPETHEFAVMFGLLVILGFSLKNYGNLESQAKTIYTGMTGTTSSITSALKAS